MLVLFFNPSQFGRKIHPEIMFFWDTFLDTLFAYLCLFYAKMFDLGTPSKSSGCQNPPTPAGVRRCRIREDRIWPEPELKEPTWIINGPPLLDFGPPKSRCFRDLGLTFCQHQKTIKNKLAKIHQNLKSSQLGRPRLQFWWLVGAILDHQFQSIFLPT